MLDYIRTNLYILIEHDPGRWIQMGNLFMMYAIFRKTACKYIPVELYLATDCKFNMILENNFIALLFAEG